METVLFFIAATGASIQAIIGLSFFISCVCEKEPRATVYSGIQFLLMLGLVVILFYLNTIGFFETNTGLTFLIIGLALAGGMAAAQTLARLTAAVGRLDIVQAHFRLPLPATGTRPC